MSLVVSDQELERQAIATRAAYNAGTMLRLYQTNIAPTPANQGTLVECTFPGYAQVDLSGDWSAPLLEVSGRWSIQTSLHLFQRGPGAGASQTAWGAYVVDPLTGDPLMAELLTVPFVFAADGDNFSVRVRRVFLAGAV